MNADEKYLFDLNGYLVIKNVLTPEEVAIANEAIDRHSEHGHIRSRDQALDGGSPKLKGEQGRGELSGMLHWEEPWCNPFRHMLAHPTLVPYLNVILGKGFRMDHQMFLLSMDKGAEGHTFHGSSGPGFDPNQYYIFRDGRMHNGLTVVTFQLTDVPPGVGGLIVIPGSHKSNYPCPQRDAALPGTPRAYPTGRLQRRGCGNFHGGGNARDAAVDCRASAPVYLNPLYRG